MEGLTIFNNEQFGSVRAVSIDGEPWFVGKDIAGGARVQQSEQGAYRPC